MLLRLANCSASAYSSHRRRYRNNVEKVKQRPGAAMFALELLRQLRSQGPVRGIALSGYGMDEDIARSREAGFSQHLTKPIDLDRLHAAIDAALA